MKPPEADIWIFEHARALLSEPSLIMARFAGNFFLWMPVLASVAAVFFSQTQGVSFRRLFFMLAAGILAYQICGLLAIAIGLPGPVFLQPGPRPGELMLIRESAAVLPDWGSGAFFAVLSFCLSTPDAGRWRAFFAAFAASFLFFRLTGGYSFLSGIACGAVIGTFTGILLLRLSRRMVIS